MKGLILSGGKGTRLRPLTYTRAKQLLPLANKPVLLYAMESLLAAGIREIGIVVGDTHAEIEAAVGDGAQWRDHWGTNVRITYIPQAEPLGLAHAVKISQPFLGADRFVMYLGDNLIGQSLTSLVDAFNEPNCPYTSHILLTEVENPSQFGIAEIETVNEATLRRRSSQRAGQATAESRRRRATRMDASRSGRKPGYGPRAGARKATHREAQHAAKQSRARRHLFFDPEIFAATDPLSLSARGELEITDAIQWFIDQGHEVRAKRLGGYWIDTGKMEESSMPIVRSCSMPPTIDPTARISRRSSFSGVVIVERGAMIENSVIRGPAIIGERATLRNAYVGPFTSIYHDAVVEE